MVLRVQSSVCVCAVTATHLVMSELCEKVGWKQKEPRRSQSNGTRSWKQACHLANIHATFWKTELARTWKEPKDGWNLWCNFYFCESRPHQYQRLVVRNGHSLTPMWKSNPQYALQLHEPHVTWTILWYFAYLANFPWFYNSMSEQQNVRNIHQHGFPSRRHHYFPSQPVAFRQEGYQWKDLKQLGSMCMWFNEST